MPIEFKAGGSSYTLGVEEELHVVDATTAELAPKIDEIMARLEDLAEFVSYELFQSVLEIKTPVCRTAAEAEKHLRELGQDRLLGRGLRRFSGRRRHPPLLTL